MVLRCRILPLPGGPQIGDYLSVQAQYIGSKLTSKVLEDAIMATYTDAQLLESVREAINTIATGAQSYSIAGRTYTRGNLKELMELEKTLQRRVNTAAQGGHTLAEF